MIAAAAAAVLEGVGEGEPIEESLTSGGCGTSGTSLKKNKCGYYKPLLSKGLQNTL